MRYGPAMRTSRSFVPTLKETPADASVASHQLLVRAGFIRQLAAGIYSILPLELRSYRQLPQTWYQIQTKFRDEPRPKSGLLRVRQFTMKDSYSFDVDRAGLDRAFEEHRQAYVK